MLILLVKKTLLLMLPVLLVLVILDVQGASFDGSRMRSGLKLFRSVLAADRDLKRKQTVDGQLLVLLVYTDEDKNAELFGRELEEIGFGGKKGMVLNMQLKVRVISYQQLDEYVDKRVAGVYLTQPLADQPLQQFIRYGIEKHIVVYSPFEGDVDKGVLGGLFIDTSVHPLINLDTMRASELRIKSLFLKVAKKHES